MKNKDLKLMCLNPIQIRPKYKSDHPWFLDQNRVNEDQFLLVPCGRCVVCKYKLCREWSNRIQLEMEYYGGAERCAFVTLTYDENNLPKDKSVHKQEVQLYLKRLRERLGSREIKYYAIGDYGELRARPHYHLIIMNVDGKDYYDQLGRLKRKEKLIKIKDDWWHMHKAWQGRGFTDIQRPRSCGGVGSYIANYLSKMSKAEEHAKKLGLQPPFRMMSKGLGLRRTIHLARQMANNPDTVFPINYLERKGTDGKNYKFALGRYLRHKLHYYAKKMGVYRAQKQIYIRKAMYEYAYLGINAMETAHKQDPDTQELLRIKESKARFKLGDCK